MKNKGLIITLIVLLSIIVVLLTISLVVCLGGGISFNNAIMSIETKSSKVIFDKEIQMSDIKNIEIKQDTGDIIFKETSNDYIQVVVYGEDENDVKVNINENKIDINYTNTSKFVWFNFGTIKNDIIVYIPYNYINEIKIKNDYGNIEIGNLENATVDVDSDCGNVEIGKIKNVTAKCDYGNITIKEILNKCEIKADCGNVEVKKMIIKEKSTIKADLGNVAIGETNDIYIDANVDLGKTDIRKNNSNSDIILKIECNCGNVSVGE